MKNTIRLRQEVLNTALSELIGLRGIEATPERVLHSQGKKMPDVIFRFNGVRVVVECEVGGNAGAKTKSIESARKRVEDGIADVALALVYAPELAAQPSVAKVKQMMRSGGSVFEVAVVTESASGSFASGDFDLVFTVLHEAWRQLLTDDVLGQTVKEIDAAVEKFAEAVDVHSGVVEKLAGSLGIQGGPDKKVESDDE